MGLRAQPATPHMPSPLLECSFFSVLMKRLTLDLCDIADRVGWRDYNKKPIVLGEERVEERIC